MSQPSYQTPPPTSSSSRVAAAFRCANGAATYLRARIDGQRQDCLLDIGSEVSPLPASLVRSELIRPTTQSLRAGNGKTTVPFHVDDFTSTVTGLVSDHTAEVMLEVDCLEDNNASWDFRQATVRFGRHYYGLRRRRGPMQESNLAGRCQCFNQVRSRCAGKDSFPWTSREARRSLVG